MRQISEHNAIFFQPPGLAPRIAGWIVLVLISASCKPGEKLKALKVGESQAAEQQNLRTTDVQSGDFRITVSATGKVVPITQVEVLSKASGEVIELPHETGDRVKKGELLARVDPIDEQRNVKKSEAALDSAKAKLEKAKSELELARSNCKKSLTESEASVQMAETKVAETEAKYQRQAQLFQRNLVPKEDLDTALSVKEQARTDKTRAIATREDMKNLQFQVASREQDIKLAEVDVANAQIALDDARKRLADTQVLAPMDGVVTERQLVLGQVISSPISNVGGGTKLLTVADLSVLYVVTSVDETDIGGIEVGQAATITADSFPGQKFEGIIAHVAPIGVAVNSVVTFDVKVEVKGEGLNKLRPGMTADVTIILKESKDTFWAQSEAIQKDGDASFVEVLNSPDAPRKVPVEIGLSDGLRTQIVKGVEAGQKLVLREKEGLSAWERGEGVYRPMKSEMRNPFMKKKKSEGK